MTKIDINDINSELHSEVKVQDYSKKEVIEGVKIVNLNDITDEVGDFCEILRIDSKGELELFPGFKLAQINRTRLLPGSVKAWHLHFKQDELWYVPPLFHLFVGLWDVREKSPTKGATMRIALGDGKSRLLYIPKGVAHGSAVFSTEPVNLYYFVNQQFNIKDPDERRIRWDYLGAEFWTPQRD